MRRFTLVAAFTASASMAFASGVTRDSAQECYLATLDESSPENNRAGLQSCGAALEGAVDDDMRARILANRAFIRLRMGDYLETIADANASLKLMPDLAAADLNLGAGLIGLERYQEALPVLEKAVALSTADKLKLAYYNRGIAREHLGDIRGAYLDYKKAAELDPHFKAAQDQLARFAITSGPARTPQ